MKPVGVLLIALAVLLVACSSDVAECDAVCMVQSAIDAKDPGKCAELDAELRTWCFNDIAKALGESGVCANILDERAVAFCVSNVAASSGDVELCRDLEHVPARELCLYELANARSQADLCAEISEGEYRDTCAYEIARLTEDPADCEYISDVAVERKCLFFRATDNADQSICEGIEDRDWWKQWCKVNVAISLLDTSLCDNVQNTSMRSQCNWIISQELGKI